MSKPEKNEGLLSLENNELNPKLPKIVELAQRQRQENILNVIRHNDFEHGYKNNGKIDILKEESKDKLGIDYETQLRILIACEENAELRENLNEYVRISRNHNEFDEEKLVEDILTKNYSFL